MVGLVYKRCHAVLTATKVAGRKIKVTMVMICMDVVSLPVFCAIS